MAEDRLSLSAERWLDQVMLTKSKSAIDGDQADTWLLPVGIGDVALMEMMVEVASIATLVGSVEMVGVQLMVLNAAADTVRDIAGVERWVRTGAATIAAYLSPDPLVLVRQDEKFLIRFGEVDTNVTPTGVLQIFAKVVRVKQVPAVEMIGGIQLVR